MRRSLLILAVVAAVAGCGDRATTDERGFTKAPLERPGLMIGSEPESELASVSTAPQPGLTGTPVAEATAGMPGAEGGGAGGGGEDSASAEVTLAAGVTQDQFDQGRELFTGKGGCTACHGMNAQGTQMAPNLTDSEWLHVDAPTVDAIAGVIRSGVPNPLQHPGPMPPMGGANLSDEEIQALAGYVASIGGG